MFLKTENHEESLKSIGLRKAARSDKSHIRAMARREKRAKMDRERPLKVTPDIEIPFPERMVEYLKEFGVTPEYSYEMKYLVYGYRKLTTGLWKFSDLNAPKGNRLVIIIMQPIKEIDEKIFLKFQDAYQSTIRFDKQFDKISRCPHILPLHKQEWWLDGKIRNFIKENV